MQNRLLRCLVVVLGLAMLPALLSAEEFAEGQVYRHTLKNGMVVFTVERHIAPLVYHQLTYRVGSRNEHLGITGISHIVEHMMFKGTPKYGKGEASKTITRNAGIFNAFTSNDMTSYYEYLPANRIDVALDIESDRMQNAIFDTAEFRSEVKVIKQERRMRSESTSNGVIHENLNSMAYSSHPNRDPVIGWPGDLDNVTRERAYQYYKTYYSPNNAFLVLVGDFNTAAIVQQVENYYGGIPSSILPRELMFTDQPQRVKKAMTIKHNDFTAPMLSFAFHVPTIHDEDGPALRIAGQIFAARSRTARLYRRLVEQRQIATSAAGGMGTTMDPTLFRITVGMMKDSSLQTAEALVWEEVKGMQDSLVSERELQRVKNRFVFDQVSEYTKNSDIGSRLSTYERYFGWEYIDEHARRVQALTREDIQRVMRKYFVEENVTMVYGYPKNPNARAAKKTEVEDEEKSDEDRPNICPINEMNGMDLSFFRAPWLDPTAGLTAPDKKEIVRPKPIAPLVKQGKLDNGIPIYTIENHLTPTIFVGGIFRVGLIPEAEKKGKPGVVSMAIDVMNRGTKNMPYEEFIEHTSFIPFTFSVGGSSRSLYFQGQSLIKDVDVMLTTGLEVLTQPGFRTADIEKLRLRHLEGAKKRRKTTREIAFFHMFERIFDGHPYSQTDGTVESINAISREDLVKIHGTYLHPKNLTIVVVGDKSHREMVALANKYFGRWSKPETAPVARVMPRAKPLAGKEIKLFRDPEYTESTINIGFAPFNDVDPNDEETVSILNHILSGSALTSRMGIELRDKRGLIYGIKGELWSTSDHIGYWKFNTKTAPKNTEEVITVIFAEIRKMLDHGVTDDEVENAKNRMLGLLPFYVETPDDIASRVFELLNRREPLDSFDKKADRLLAVTKDDVLRVAKKYFTLDRFIVVVDGPLDEHALDGLTDKLSK